MKFKYFFSLLFIIVGVFTLLASQAQAAFDANYIISDQEILDENSMTQVEIQTLLTARKSYLATYQTTNPDGLLMSAAQIIYDRAVTNHISPKFLIVLLQKEQGLIEDPAPKQSQLDWATGYGCPDGGGCNERWRGFWKQINSASLQFRDYMDNPQLYHYRMGQTYTITNTGRDPMIVTPQNQATAALYNYTPHVYNGNYNFWKLWQRYFTLDYLNGSLLQANGEAGVWLIENGKKRAFLTKSALTSRFNPSRIQIVSRADLDKYETGEPIKFSQYSIIRTENGRIYLLVDNYKRRFLNPEAFRKMGFNPEEIIQAYETELSGYIEGTPISTTSTYPTGALLQDRKTGGVYWVNENTKAPLWDSILLKTRFKDKKITPSSAQELALYQTVEPVKLLDGDIVRTNASPAIYIIENGLKRPVDSAETFLKLGYKWTNVIFASTKLLSLHQDGILITAQ